MAYNIRVGEVWYPSFPDADPFTKYSIIEEAIIMNIELNAYGEYYIQYEIMDAFLFIKRFDKKIIKI